MDKRLQFYIKLDGNLGPRSHYELEERTRPGTLKGRKLGEMMLFLIVSQPFRGFQ